MSANGNGDTGADAQLFAPRRSAKTHAADHQLHRSTLQTLNEVVSVATRRAFQSQLLQHALTHPSAIRQQLPELCAFVDELFQVPSAAANGSKSGNSTAAARSNAAAVRRVFRDPDAQWLTRSAAQSGVSALLCGQLLRCADEHFAARQDQAPAQLVIAVLCDQLLTPCTLRLGTFSRKCEWRDRKPAYHAMPCFSTWDTLFPFAERMARRFPQAFEQMIARCACKKQADSTTARVNCSFAHVVGLWRLMEALGGSSNSATQGSSRSAVARALAHVAEEDATLSLLSTLLQFTASSRVLGIVTSPERLASHEDVKRAASYDDLLMDKFFSGLQEFMFSCPRSKHVARHALQSSIVASILECVPPHDGEEPVSATEPRVVAAGLAMFAGVTCLFVKGLADSIASRLITDLKSSTRRGCDDPLLLFVVGFCAHVDLVSVDAVFSLLDSLLDMFTSAAEASDQDARVQMLFFMVYVAIYRTEAARSLRHQIGSSHANEIDADWNPALLNFQDRFSGQVDSEDFYAMPVEWMAILWREWFAFSDDDLASFITAHEDYRHRQQHQVHDDSKSQALSVVKRLEQQSQIAFQDVDAVFFVRQMQLLRPHFIPSSHVEKLLSSSLASEGGRHEGDTVKRLLSTGSLYSQCGQKKRRIGAPVDPEAEERRLNVLMLPEVMERVCSYMSAKRLCRLAVVCQAFAKISRSGRLWRQLYFALSSKEVEALVCTHGIKYHHDWQAQYRERWEARKKQRRRQRAINTTHQRRLLAQDPDSVDTTAAMVITELPFRARLCHLCGCSQLLSSQSQVDEHLRLHEQFKCADQSSCGATFTSLAQLKKHVKQEHPEEARSTAESAAAPSFAAIGKKPKISCGFAGCAKSYTSLKRLESHRKLKSHHLPPSAA